jgi:hypothetical protein
MKQLFFGLCIFAISLLSCKKATGEINEDLYRDAPRSEMPDELAPAEWRYGSVSALSYYNDRGNHVAHAEEALREYKVTKDGYVEFVQYLSVPTGDCYNMTYTYLKGTMKFEAPNKVTWTPVEGEFYKKFPCNGLDDTRKADQDDLERMKSEYWYRFHDFGTDKEYLVLYVDPSLEERFKAFAYEVVR